MSFEEEMSIEIKKAQNPPSLQRSQQFQSKGNNLSYVDFKKSFQNGNR
jgi:hypothetical protein